MDSMSQVDGPIHFGLDVAKNAIVVGVLLPGRQSVDVDRPGVVGRHHDHRSVGQSVSAKNRSRVAVWTDSPPSCPLNGYTSMRRGPAYRW